MKNLLLIILLTVFCLGCDSTFEAINIESVAEQEEEQAQGQEQEDQLPPALPPIDNGEEEPPVVGPPDPPIEEPPIVDPPMDPPVVEDPPADPPPVAEEPPGVSPIATEYTPTHFVSPTGTASWANATSEATPASALTAFANAQAGNVVKFAPGIYEGTGYNDPSEGWGAAFIVRNEGTESNPIVLYAEYPAVTAVAADRSKFRDLNGPADPQEARNPVLSMNNHVVLDGFWFDDSDGGKPWGRGTVYSGYNRRGQTYLRNRFDRRPADIYYKSDRSRVNDNFNCIHFHGTADVVVSDNMFNGGAITRNDPFDGVGPNRNWAAITTYGTRNYIIEHNHFESMENGIFLKGGDGGRGNHGVVRFNRFVNMQRTLSMGMAHDDPSLPTTQIYQNLFYWSSTPMHHPNFGVEFDNSVGPQNQNTWFYNNTIVLRQPVQSGGIVSENGNSHVNNMIKNNIVAAIGTIHVALVNFWEEPPPTQMAEFDHNLYYNNGDSVSFAVNSAIHVGMTVWQAELAEAGPDQSGGLMEANSIAANPNFVDLENYDFRLRPDSPGLTASDSGGPVGAYITGDEHIGIRYISY